MTAETLLGDLRADGFRIEAEGGRLFLSHPRRKPSPVVLSEVSRLKTELIALITAPKENARRSRAEAAPEPQEGKDGPPPVHGPIEVLRGTGDLEVRRGNPAPIKNKKVERDEPCTCPDCRADRQAYGSRVNPRLFFVY